MERVVQGFYLAEDAWSDDLYLISLLNSRTVSSLVGLNTRATMELLQRWNYLQKML